MCKKHIVKRKRYDGPLPSSITRPIRAGLLLEVSHIEFVSLVATFPLVADTADPRRLAERYIDDIGKYSRDQLSNNCFWGDDSDSRKHTGRYKRKKPPEDPTLNPPNTQVSSDDANGATKIPLIIEEIRERKRNGRSITPEQAQELNGVCVACPRRQSH